jgi:hypothetical protein
MQKVIERPKISQPTITSEIVTLTPEIARSMLDQNSNNRNVKKASVEAYARAMEDGRWLLTGDAIRFDVDKKLLDGQHRLLACIRANTPFRTIVIYNLPKEAGLTIDTNIPRRAADVLTMAGHRSATTLAAAARMLLLARTRNTFSRVGGSNRSHGRVTNQEVADVIDKHPLLPAAVARICRDKPSGCNQTTLAVLLYLGENLLDAPETARSFVNVFVTGVPSKPGCPAHALRERLVRSKAGNAQRVTLEASQMGLIHAWNLFVSGESVQTFRFPTNDVWPVGLDRKKL